MSGWVAGWHNGPTPWRCSGAWTSPAGTVIECVHPSHAEPTPQAVGPAVDARSPIVMGTPTGVLLPHAEPESPLWFAQRREGITATDVPKLLGLSRYGNALSVWMSKRGELVDDPAGEAARWGNLLEDVVAQAWASDHDVQVARIGVIHHVDHPWQRASLDRRVIGCPDAGPDGCALEVKTRSAFVAGRWADDVPDDVFVQVTWQRIVSGYDHIHVAVLLGGQRLVHHVVRADEDIEALCRREAQTAWDHVLAGTAPYVDPTPLLTELLDAMHGQREGTLDLSGDPRVDDVVRMVEQRRAALAAARAATAAADAAKAGLVQVLGDASVAVADGRELFTYRTSTRRSTNWRALRKAATDRPWRGELDALVEANTATTTSRSLILPDPPAYAEPEREVA